MSVRKTDKDRAQKKGQKQREKETLKSIDVSVCIYSKNRKMGHDPQRKSRQ